MRLSYRREVKSAPNTWDNGRGCIVQHREIVLTIRVDGQDVGAASLTCTNRIYPYTGRPRFRGNPRAHVSRTWRELWRINLPGRTWTIPGIRTRTEVLAEIKQHLTKEARP
jgi:hypothetical protein